MPNIYIMRGLPGSGKTTKAREIAEKSHNWNRTHCVVSADNYFVIGDYYKFDASQLGAAHNRCKWICETVMKDKLYDDIIIDNTNTTKKEVRPYIELALKYKYDIEIVLPETLWQFGAETCYNKCTHNVPLDTIKKMLARFEMFDLEDFIKEVKEDIEIQKEIDSLGDSKLELSEGSRTLIHTKSTVQPKYILQFMYQDSGWRDTQEVKSEQEGRLEIEKYRNHEYPLSGTQMVRLLEIWPHEIFVLYEGNPGCENRWTGLTS